MALWTPADIETALWLDAAASGTITLDGSNNVEQWDDKSGENRHISQASSGLRPAISEGGVDTAGGKYLLRTSTFLFSLGSMSLFIVMKAASTATGQYPVGEGSTTSDDPVYGPMRGNLHPFQRGDAGTYGLDATLSLGTAWDLNTCIMCVTDSGSTMTGYRDGIAGSTPRSYTRRAATMNRLCFGGLLRASFVNAISAIFFEIVALPGVASTEIRQKIEGYLAHKWGLEGNLPSDHPYKEHTPYRIEIKATGGEISYCEDNGKQYKVHTFTESGDFIVTEGDDEVEYLVVAGGGAGAGGIGGGGGAGGCISGSKTVYYPGTYSVVVGDGGIGGLQTTGGDGENSSFVDITATGGGGGGKGGDHKGRPGGSGGGAGLRQSTGGSGIVDQGNDGGDSAPQAFPDGNAGGGGGGAGAVGGNGSNYVAGDGGDGTSSSINGITTFYAGGGGGGSRSGGSPSTAGTGGAGGGGDGSVSGDGVDAFANTGGGGGGGGYDTADGLGGHGGSGIVIVRYILDWYRDWAYRKSVTLRCDSGIVEDYQMKILVGESSGSSDPDVHCEGECNSDFSDLRFTAGDGTSRLNYWIESVSGDTPDQLAVVWVKFDYIGVDNTTFYMYYGNPTASGSSNGDDAFELFDDFAGDVLDTAKWDDLTGNSLGGTGEHGQILTITSSSNDWRGIVAKTTFGVDYRLRFRAAANPVGSTTLIQAIGFGTGTDRVHSQYSQGHVEPAGPYHTCRSADTGTDSAASGLSSNVYFRGDTIRNASTSGIFRVDGANEVTISTNVPTVSLSPMCRAIRPSGTTNAVLYVDWIAVLRFLAVEPAWGSWGEQESLIEEGFYFSGYVYELGSPVERTIYAYRRDSGELVASGTSVSGTGYFYLETVYNGAHFIVCLDNLEGETYNLLGYDLMIPEAV